MQEILISGGTVVTAEGRFDADVRVRDGTIVEIGTGLAAGAGAREIDATGLRVMPGGVDPHVHLGGRTRDDYRTGSQAALAGGITTISNFAFPAEGRTLAQAIEREAALIREQAIADVILHAGINSVATREGEMATLAAGNPARPAPRSSWCGPCSTPRYPITWRPWTRRGAPAS